MSVAVIADAHLGGPGGPPEPLLEQLAALRGQGCERLVLLGDLFHVWVAAPRYETPEVRRLVAAIAALGRQGIAVDYVEGNRDFFVAGSPYASVFDRVGSEVSFTAGRQRVLAVHGDGLDANDRLYRFWRRLSKSGPSRWAMRHLPRRLAHRLVHATERGLARTNFEHKTRIPEAVIRDYGQRRLAQGHDLLLLGHFHEPRIWRVAAGEIRLLEAWFRTRRVEWYG